MDTNKKVKLAWGALLAIIAIAPPAVIFWSMYHGTNGFGIGCLTLCYTAALARGVFELADHYLIRSKNWGVMVVKWIAFLFVPWSLFIFAFVYVGGILNEHAVNQEREESVQEGIVGIAAQVRGKLDAIDSLVSLYGRAGEDYVAVEPVSDFELDPLTLLAPEAVRQKREKMKTYEKVAQLFAYEHEHYQSPHVDSLNVPAVILWFANDEAKPFQTGKRDAAYPAIKADFKMADLADLEKMKRDIPCYFTDAHKNVLWASGINAFRGMAEDIRDARYLVFVNYEHLLKPQKGHLNFTGGAISARLALWDFSRQAFTDTLHVYTENSEKVATTRRPGDSKDENLLYDDLRDNLHKDIIVALSHYKP